MLRILHVSDTQWPDGSEEKSIVAFAKERGVDYIIHTGDLIDRKKKYTSLQAWEIIRHKLDILVNSSGIPLILIPGNHDPESFHRKSPLAKRESLDQVLTIFQRSGAIVPDSEAISLDDGISLSYLNRFKEDDFFYGIAVPEPIAKPKEGQVNLAIAHGVGYVPYQLIFQSRLSWPQAVAIERRNTSRRLREIIEFGYDIILCGHHRHSNVRNGLFHYQGKLLSLRGQHRTEERNVDQIAGYGTYLEIENMNIKADTVDLIAGDILDLRPIPELEDETC